MAQKSNWENVIRWIVLAILAVVALKVLAGVLALAWVLGSVLIWKVLPLVALVWVVMKVLEWMRGKNCGGGHASYPADPIDPIDPTDTAGAGI
jgi:hypothetical protein